MFTQMSRKFHLDSTATSDNSVSFDSSENNHDSIVKRTSSFFNILRSTTTNNKSDSLCAFTLSKEVISFRSKLFLLKHAAISENFVLHAMHSCLNLGTGCFANSIEIPLRNTTRAENVSISEVLSSQITDW